MLVNHMRNGRKLYYTISYKATYFIHCCLVLIPVNQMTCQLVNVLHTVHLFSPKRLNLKRVLLKANSAHIWCRPSTTPSGPEAWVHDIVMPFIRWCFYSTVLDKSMLPSSCPLQAVRAVFLLQSQV